MTKSSRLILQISHPGLGDHLFLSPIPRIAKETGAYSEVYISNFSNFRDGDLKNIVWKENPFIDGFLDEIGVIPPDLVLGKEMNLLDAFMLELGLDDGKRFHEPELYFKATNIPELNEMTIYDPNYVSFVGFISRSKILDFFRREKISLDLEMKLRERNYSLDRGLPSFTTESLEQYCNVILSAKQFVCLSSGSATLAAALGKPSIVFWGRRQKRMFHHSKMHRYVYVPISVIGLLRYYLNKYILGWNENIRHQ